MGLFFYSLLPFKLVYIHFLSNALQSDLKVKVSGSWKGRYLSKKSLQCHYAFKNWERSFKYFFRFIQLKIEVR